MRSDLRTGLAAIVLCLPIASVAAPVEPLFSKIRKEEPALVATLRDLVNIESGSRDKAGLDKLAAQLGGKIEIHEPNAADTSRSCRPTTFRCLPEASSSTGHWQAAARRATSSRTSRLPRPTCA